MEVSKNMTPSFMKKISAMNVLSIRRSLMLRVFALSMSALGLFACNGRQTAEEPTPAIGKSTEAGTKLQFELDAPLPTTSAARIAYASWTNESGGIGGVQGIVEAGEVLPARILFIQGSKRELGTGIIKVKTPAADPKGDVKFLMEATIPSTFDKTTLSKANPLKVIWISSAESLDIDGRMLFETKEVIPAGVKVGYVPPSLFQVWIESAEVFEKGNQSDKGWTHRPSFLWTIMAIPVHNATTEAITPTQMTLRSKTVALSRYYRVQLDSYKDSYVPWSDLTFSDGQYKETTLPIHQPTTIQPGQTHLYYIPIHPEVYSYKSALHITVGYQKASGESASATKSYGIKTGVSEGVSFHLSEVTVTP